MPAIELRGTPDDFLWVHAIKLFPNDKAHRDQLFTMERVRYEVRDIVGGQVIPVSANVLQILLESPSFKNMMSMAQEAAKRACIAADILCTIYLMDRFSLPEPSVNKAVAVVQANAPTATYGDGSRMDTSETQSQVLARVQTGSTSLGREPDQQSLSVHERPQEHVHRRL